MIANQINDNILSTLSTYLCGFRKGMSAQNCLLFIIEYIYSQLRFGNPHNIFYYLRGLSQVSLKQFL